MESKIAFVEVPEQLGEVPSGYRIFSLAPAVEAALKESAGRPAFPEDYLDQVEVEREGIENYKRVEDLCTEVDGILARTIDEVSTWSLQPLRWHYFWLKIAYDAFFIRARQIRSLLDAEHPAEVLYFKRGEPDPAHEWISQSESIYCQLLDVILPARGIAGRRLEPVMESRGVRIGPAHTNGRFELGRLRRGAVRRARRALEAVSRVRARPNGRRVLCLDYGYSVPLIAEQLRLAGYDVWVWEDGQPVHRLGSPGESVEVSDTATDAADTGEAWRAIEESRPIRDLFVWDGADAWDAMAPRLRAFVERGTSDVLSVFRSAQKAIDLIEPDAVLMSMASEAREKTICHAVRLRGIPSVVSRHGELGNREFPIATYQDVDSVDWCLAWGEWEAAWTTKYGREGIRTAVVGSPMIEAGIDAAPVRDQIRRRLGYDPADRIVLYVPASLSGNHWYASYRTPPDNIYFRQGLQIVQSMLGLEDWKVAIKEHTVEPSLPFEVWLRSRDLAERVSAFREPPYRELVHFADAIVIDFPSTTLIQAMAGSARIYLVDSDLFRWEPGVVEELEALEITLCEAGGVGDSIRADIVAGRFSAPPMRSGGATGGALSRQVDRGGAARRAAHSIREIAVEARTPALQASSRQIDTTSR